MYEGSKKMTGKPHLLIAEDELFIAMMLEDILTDEGYRVSGVTALGEGLIAAERGNFDAAILDVNLGRDLVFPLAERLRDQGVPLMFASGYGSEGIPEDFSGYEVLLKPFDSKTLLAALSKLVTPPAK